MTWSRAGFRLAGIAVGLVVSVALTACENFAAAPTASPATSLATNAIPATNAVPATTENSSTSRATADDVTTDAPAGTSSATTTAAPSPRDLEAEAEIRVAMANINDRWAKCGAALPACDVDSFALGLTDPLLSLTQEWAAKQNQAGVTSTNTDTITMRVDDITVTDDTAIVTTCETNGGVLYNKDGSVLDGEFISSKGVWTLVLVDERWLARGHSVADKASGVANNLCLG